MADGAAPVAPPEPLFFEPGASWYLVLAGPVAAAVMLGLEITAGLGPRPAVPAIFLVLVSSFLAVQIKAARIHTSVELTGTTLRQGAETIDLDEIVRIFPLPDSTPGAAPERWQSARALGELSSVPRRRTGIGVKLAGDRIAQAWARRDAELRAALIAQLEQRGIAT